MKAEKITIQVFGPDGNLIRERVEIKSWYSKIEVEPTPDGCTVVIKPSHLLPGEELDI